ncbi:START domain-containing protein [Dyadobacter sp. CY343]|uniref:START domain-containing protein n=1 Tax=Dyadobacter sp. CY343 TaxID=2907299 RepID=UPI001F28B71D|nr:START domain-containing protein [Dyadobacter sp. CY343]MCE7060877.1 START domain-containing protein [Dyadobacter sp. CY343]
MKKIIVILIGILFPAAFAAAQPDWVVATEKDGVKVYSKTVPDSRIKALKAEYVMEATVEEILDLLVDIPATTKWMCHAKACVLLKKISEQELYYYTEVSLPWPLDNRDFVTHLKITQDPVTKIVTVNSPAVAGEVAPKKGLVRVNHSQSVWKIVPAGERKVKLEYTLRTDPGGLIPAHVVNHFARQAPVETFLNMQGEIRSRREKRNANAAAKSAGAYK